MDNYLIISFEDKLFSLDDFKNVNFLKFGNDKFYYITKNNIPFLTVEVALTFNPFDDAVIFRACLKNKSCTNKRKMIK